jgi:hypothetical protein
MPTKRQPLTRPPRPLVEGSPDALWKAGRYIEAMALDPLVEFRFAEPVLTHRQVCKARDLRAELGLDDADQA